MKKILLSIFSLVLVFGMSACTSKQVPEEVVIKEPETVAETEAETPAGEEVAIPADGTYEGVAEAFHGDIKVEVVVEGGAITAVNVLEEDETPEIGGPVVESMPGEIVAANSPDVDIVSGATWTSEGIINAVKDALSQ